MAKFSAEAFKKELQKKADKSVRSQKTTIPIAEKAKEIMHDTIKQTVYDSYSPKVYERRGENGGLLDRDNIVATVSENHIFIENTARPSESILGEEFRDNPNGLLYQWIDEGRIGIPSEYPGIKYFVLSHLDRRGMTDDIKNDIELKEFIGKKIIENME